MNYMIAVLVGIGVFIFEFYRTNYNNGYCNNNP